MRKILNVANHLRQGYGGQDVEVLPVANHLRQGYGGQDVANYQEREFNAELSRTKSLIQFHKMRILCGIFLFITAIFKARSICGLGAEGEKVHE